MRILNFFDFSIDYAFDKIDKDYICFCLLAMFVSTLHFTKYLEQSNKHKTNLIEI